MDYATFAAVIEQIEAGQAPTLDLDTVQQMLDVARRRRVTLNPMVAGYLNTIVGQSAPPGYEQFFEYDGSRVRVVLRKQGRRSSLDREGD